MLARSAAVTKCHDKATLFTLAYGSRGLGVYSGGEGKARQQRHKAERSHSNHTQEAGRTGSGVKLQPLKASVMGFLQQGFTSQRVYYTPKELGKKCIDI